MSVSISLGSAVIGGVIALGGAIGASGSAVQDAESVSHGTADVAALSLVAEAPLTIEWWAPLCAFCTEI